MRSALVPFWNNRNNQLSNLRAVSLFDDVDQFLQDFAGFSRRDFEALERFTPAVNMVETENDFRLSLDLPGMNKDQIKISLDDRTLTITGERKFEKEASDKNKFLRFERSYGSFQRSFTLPSAVENKEIKAKYNDGVLEVTLPKTPEAKARTIDIA